MYRTWAMALEAASVHAEGIGDGRQRGTEPGSRLEARGAQPSRAAVAARGAGGSSDKARKKFRRG